MMDTAKIRILVLDDDRFILRLANEMLARLGYTLVTICDNGRDALAALDGSSSAPDVILLDLNMPDMDGVEFARELVTQRFAGGVILISGEDLRTIDTVEKLLRAQQIHVLGHLCKPLRPQEFAGLIDAWSPVLQHTQRALRKLYLKDELRAAISGGQLINHYQPQVRATDGRLMGVEALVRWRHPVDGMTFPDQFITVAETHGLIGDLTDAVLQTALAQARIWQLAGLSLRVAVNVSMDTLALLDFPDRAAAAAANAGVKPELIVLEVTESRLVANIRSAMDVLSRLRLKRFRLSIDDFGTGYSSLAQLRDLPFDEIKVDRGFVHGAAVDDKRLAIFQASLGLARQLGIEPVAEGVEDGDDWRLLLRLGCDLAQGYFIGKPMPAEQFPDWLARWKRRLSDESLLDA